MSTTERTKKGAPRRKKRARKKHRHWSYSISSREYLIAFLLVLIVAALSVIYYWRSTTLVTTWEPGMLVRSLSQLFGHIMKPALA